ncbi:predicted protein [Sclerotinia sclerotiorum 1980 UF-70]|uniref:DUF7730 domain-containing protein n=1 Tax=Sclerotinia sclerotiorum (strain ATCC 18683 / 1980 / Ss-1) TaxID=665079 RepID=A7EWN3_SCLS1|nr:predicted protein [Sclerotinia sclerotiorum 1980 UF-70]EDN93875.1 predicted protein [Sclerotinia sclerotiorum 1980 UF-70]
MEGNASQVNQPESSVSSREIATRFVIHRYLNTIKSRFQDDPTIYEQFIHFTENFQEDGDMSSGDLEMVLEVLFRGHDDLIQEYHNLRPTFEEAKTFYMERKREEEEAEVEEMKRIADATRRDHIRACEVQSKSTLLRLPREIRDTIWKDVVSENIVHISRDANSSSYSFHSCVAPNGLKSSACPSGKGDHTQCATTGPSDFPSYRLICKQINLELPDARGTLFSKSVFHFDDLVDAEEYLFGLKERDRAAITHLRLPIPYSLSTKHEDSGPEFQAWEAIINYFSCPWVRETLNLNVHDRHHKQFLKQPWFFYYSSCYYQHNRHRLYKKWQIRFGDTSWDMDIASLRYKGEPKLDIGMDYPASDGVRFWMWGELLLGKCVDAEVAVAVGVTVLLALTLTLTSVIPDSVDEFSVISVSIDELPVVTLLPDPEVDVLHSVVTAVAMGKGVKIFVVLVTELAVFVEVDLMDEYVEEAEAEAEEETDTLK